MTHGKKHRFVDGAWWQQLLSRLPFGWSARFRSSAVTFQTTNESSVVWLMWTGLPAQVYTYTPVYVITDSHGQKVALSGECTLTQHGKNAFIDGRPLIVPAVGKHLRLGFYRLDSNGQAQCVAEFKIPQVRHRAGAAFMTAEVLPVRRIAGKTEITLTKLLVEKDVRTNAGFAVPLTHLFLRITEDGSPTTNWFLANVTFADARGNRSYCDMISYPIANGEEWAAISAPLFPDEPWNLQMEFKRRGRLSGERPVAQMVVKPQLVSERVEVR